MVYGATHAFNVKVDGRGIATFGDTAMLSFHATKVFNTIEGRTDSRRKGMTALS